MRVKGKRPRAKGMGEGGGWRGLGLCLNNVDFLHFDFRGILGTISNGNKTDQSTIQGVTGE